MPPHSTSRKAFSPVVFFVTSKSTQEYHVSDAEVFASCNVSCGSRTTLLTPVRCRAQKRVRSRLLVSVMITQSHQLVRLKIATEALTPLMAQPELTQAPRMPMQNRHLRSILSTRGDLAHPCPGWPLPEHCHLLAPLKSTQDTAVHSVLKQLAPFYWQLEKRQHPKTRTERSSRQRWLTH